MQTNAFARTSTQQHVTPSPQLSNHPYMPTTTYLKCDQACRELAHACHYSHDQWPSKGGSRRGNTGRGGQKSHA